jgi:hypothetical protein
MRLKLALALLVAGCVVMSVHAQRRSGGLATLAITVTDPTGTPLTGVRVTLEGPASRQTRTERGRIAFEELPVGTYRLRFDHDEYLSFEREVVARAGAPIDVKVTLTPAPKPPPPPPEPAKPAPPPVLNVSPAAIDVPDFLEKNYVGRAVGKVSPLTCATAGSAVLLQMREPLEEHAHDDSDEFAYVIAGEGTARIAGADHRLQAGMLLMVPRTVRHGFTARGRNPLVVISIKAGLPCP